MSHSPPPPTRYSLAEACRLLRISRSTWRRAGWETIIPTVRERGRVWADKRVVDEAAQHQTRDDKVAAALRLRKAMAVARTPQPGGVSP